MIELIACGVVESTLYVASFSNQWVTRTIYHLTSQDFHKDLVHSVIQRELEKKVKLAHKHFHVHPADIPAKMLVTEMEKQREHLKEDMQI